MKPAGNSNRLAKDKSQHSKSRRPMKIITKNKSMRGSSFGLLSIIVKVLFMKKLQSEASLSNMRPSLLRIQLIIDNKNVLEIVFE